MSPTSSEMFNDSRRQQEARQRHFDQRMAEMIRDTQQPTLAAEPATQKAAAMPTKLIDIKGLNTKAIADVGAKMAGIRDLVAKVHDSGNRLHAELTDVHDQLEQARQDLRFHAESMGNSGSNGDISDEEKDLEDQQEAERPAPPVVPPLPRASTPLPYVSPGLDEAIDAELNHPPASIEREG